MFECHSADMRAGKFPLALMGAERRVSRAPTRERGPPSALAEINHKIVPQPRQRAAHALRSDQKWSNKGFF